jgi:hypothetical protein
MEGEGWPPEPRLYPSATIMILDAGPVPTRTQAINNMPTRAKADSAFAQLSSGSSYSSTQRQSAKLQFGKSRAATVESGHQRRFDVGGMSAIAPMATKMLRRDECRKGPRGDIRPAQRR